MPTFPMNPEDLPTGPAPRHGYQGDRTDRAREPFPAGMTVAITRESGARGGSIARRLGRKLGWPVYGQEMLEYLAANELARSQLLAELPSEALTWAGGRVEYLRSRHALGGEPAFADLAQLILALAAPGEVIFVGRGAGYLLPAAGTLHVRVVAPLADRIGYMSQYLRQSREQAVEHVNRGDALRSEYVLTHFLREPADVHSFDMVLNSSLLGEEACVDLIAQAAKLKAERLADAPRTQPA
jgi:hypothetical protein